MHRTFLVASKYHNKSGKTVRPFLYNFPSCEFSSCLEKSATIRLTTSSSSIYIQQVPIVHVAGISFSKNADSSDMNWTVLVLFVCLRPSVDCCEVRSSQLDFGTVDITFTHKDHSCMIQQYEGSRYLVIGKSAVAIWLDSSLRNH
ncbi:hypothetical protein D6D27_08759 [Aureobasidium pullulans]|nr:hypothetical protein D6D27_08759 [Aureobasidium pullulans]